MSEISDGSLPMCPKCGSAPCTCGNPASSSLAAPTGSGHVGHTPAPWKAAKGHDGDPERWCVVADRERQYLIAVIENGQPGDCCETEGATARLIAAAPELLKAVKELIFATDFADETGYVVDVGFIDIDAIKSKARAAIVKASGQNSD